MNWRTAPKRSEDGNLEGAITVNVLLRFSMGEELCNSLQGDYS